jgi:hypothetical protein
MKALVLFMISNFVLLSNVSATIINIPDDYPTIQQGIDASIDGDTVLVQPGRYVENVDFCGHSIVLASFFLISGDVSHIHETIIDGDSLDTVIKFWSRVYPYPSCEFEQRPSIIGFTIRNGHGQYGGGISCRNSSPLIAHNTIIQNSTDWAGGGIFCWTGSDPVITNNTISDNFAPEGGGLWICWSHPTIEQNTIINNVALKGAGIAVLFCDQYESLVISNSIIARNEADSTGGGIHARYSDFSILNTTITENQSSQLGTGLYLAEVSNPVILNTIFWANNTSEIHVGGWSNPVITYCDIQDTIWTGEGNISADPTFCYPDTLNYYLRDDSPCVEAGQDRVNIGALGIGCYNTGIDEFTELPNSFVTMQTFPNPFNSSTTIEYILPNSSNVTVAVYDVLGQQVEVPLKEFQTLGKHRLTWEAKDRSSGVYFILLKTPKYTKSASVTLLK